MDGRRRHPPAWLLAAAGLAVGLGLAAVLAAPRVTAFSPLTGSRLVSSRASLRISFNQPMDRLSVESRLAIEPRLDGQLAWQGNTLVFEPRQPWPAGSVVVRLGAGARSARGLPFLAGASWSFTVGTARIAYLWPAGGAADLYARAPEEARPTRLTHTALGVLDFDVSLDGARLAYAAARADGGSDLWLLDLPSGETRRVYACPAGWRCQAPRLSAKGDWLAFTAAPLQARAGGNPTAGQSRVWALRLDDASSAYPLGPEGHVTQAPEWSPAGWLAYTDATLGALALVDPGAGASAPPLALIPSQLGEAGAWSPDGAFLVYAEVVFPAATPEPTPATETETPPVFYSHLNRLNIAQGETRDLTGSGAGMVEDASPAYSPDGAWIAFARRYLDRERWTPGRQLWLMRADGTQLSPLLVEADYNHSAPAWRPDSQALAYMRFNETDFTQPAEIWWIALGGGKPQRVVTGGYQPQWIP